MLPVLMIFQFVFSCKLGIAVSALKIFFACVSVKMPLKRVVVSKHLVANGTLQSLKVPVAGWPTAFLFLQ